MTRRFFKNSSLRVKKFFSKKHPAFSLMELAIVLVIIGVISGVILKGQDLLEAARLRSFLTDVERYRTAVMVYKDTYGYLPGNDLKAQDHFGENGIHNGAGNGLISGNESAQFWVHLYKAGQLGSGEAPSAKIGGFYKAVGIDEEAMSGNWLLLGNGDNRLGAVLTPHQAASVKAKIQEKNPSEGIIRFKDAENCEGECLTNEGNLNLGTKKSACVVYISLP